MLSIVRFRSIAADNFVSAFWSDLIWSNDEYLPYLMYVYNVCSLFSLTWFTLRWICMPMQWYVFCPYICYMFLYMYCIAVIYMDIFHLSEQCDAGLDPEKHVPVFLLDWSWIVFLTCFFAVFFKSMWITEWFDMTTS